MKVLFRSAYNINPDEAFFQKKYDTRLLGSEVIGYLAIHLDTGVPAAFYGVFPVKILWNGGQIMAAQSGDTMTHEDHRKKGLFTELAKITFEECRRQGIALIFGLPNQNSYPGFIKKLGWTHLDDIAGYDLKLKVKTFPLPKLLQKSGWFNLYLKIAKRLLEKKRVKDPLQFSSIVEINYGKVLRDQEYLRYKKSSDKFFIRIDEVVFWIKLTDVLWIGDLDNYEGVRSNTIRQLKRIAFILGYNTIRFHINKTMTPPSFLQHFTLSYSEPSCFHYLSPKPGDGNLLLTGCDFDTW